MAHACGGIVSEVQRGAVGDEAPTRPSTKYGEDADNVERKWQSHPLYLKIHLWHGPFQGKCHFILLAQLRT